MKGFLQTEILYWLYRPRRILFNHLPKCAGTTVTKYLYSQYPQRFIFQTNGTTPLASVDKFRSLSSRSRYKYRLILGHHAHQLIDYVHPSIITITIFRDPVERIASHYFYVKQKQNHYLHDRVLKENIGLEDYVTLGISRELRNHYTTSFSGMSIKDAEMHPEESVRRAAQVILSKYNIIGFQDDLSAVIDKLKEEAHLYIPFDNWKHNETITRPEFQEIPDKVKKSIAEINYLDVKLYALLKTHGDALSEKLRSSMPI